ncbi:MAG TPA: hypothetical protein DCS82_06840 [Rhodospirillaceae bacterium]|nr:hypothetical protein [Rhodospirillaceae bacterium]HAT35414.1 hypothetical protein [Rhodospirillaceae bacterium]
MAAKERAADSNSVLHIITGLDTGGAETMLAALALEKLKQGSQPLIVSLTEGGSQFERLHDAGCRVIGLGMSRGQSNWKAMRRLAALIKEEKPSVVQSWMYHSDLAALITLWMSGRRRKTRLFWGVRCSDMDASRYRWLRRICAWLSRWPDGLVANSEAGLRFHVDTLAYRPRQTAVVHNGFDLSRFRYDEAARRRLRRNLKIEDNAFVIGVIARVDPMKDYPNLISALKSLEGVTALAIGRGTETLPDVRGLRKCGERDDIPQLLSTIDILVSPSAFGEGLSNVIGEAMACGRPIVATDVGDARLLIGEAGLVVAPESSEALAVAVARLRDDPELRQTMSDLARKRIEDGFQLADAVAGFDRVHGIPEHS